MSDFERAKALFLNGLEHIAREDFANAETSLRAAHQLMPERASVLINLCSVLIRLEKFDEASPLARRAVELDADSALAWLGLALCQSHSGQTNEALSSLDKAAQLDPDNHDVLVARHSVLRKQGAHAEALLALDAAQARQPNERTLWFARGNTLHDLRRFEQALVAYDRALAIDSDYADAWLNRGIALRDLRRHDEALVSLQRAARLKPDSPLISLQLATLLFEMRQHVAAIAAIDRTHELAPDMDCIVSKQLNYRMHACQWDDFEARCAALLSEVATGKTLQDPSSLLPIACTAEQQRQSAARYMQAHHPALPPLATKAPYTHKRLRIGYFSADFFEHATAWLMVGLFENHDRERFETYAFSIADTPRDAMRERLEKCFEHFMDVARKSDAEIAQLARSLELDIIIDLKGLTTHSRPSIFASRPAPIQVSYLGYPGTLGTTYFDYLIADNTLIPPEQGGAYSEKIVYMPDSYQVNDAGRTISPRVPGRTECGLPEEGFVFCSFNYNYKITPDVFDIWMRLLAQTPGSVLWLIASNPASRTNLQHEAQRRNISPSRLVFAEHVPLPEHLARHACADLFLDTFYYNAHTTCSDALWAGLPVITCPGTTFASRVAASLLNATDMPDLIAQSVARYEALALELSRDPQRLASLRRQLIDKRQHLHLFDTTRFTRNLERAYVTMQDRLTSGMSVDNIHL